MCQVLSESGYNAIIWSFTITTLIFTLLRFYTRTYVLKALGLDDALAFLGQFFALCLAGLLSWNSHYIHRIADIHEEDPEETYVPSAETVEMLDYALMSTAIAEIFRHISLPIIKCSIVAFYWRITPLRKHHYLLSGIALAILTEGLVSLLLNIFPIHPISARFGYDSGDDIRWVVDFDALRISDAAFHVLYDVVLLSLPLPIIFRTKLHKRDRAGLILVYVLCFTSIAGTIGRLIALTEYSVVGFFEKTIKGRLNDVHWTVVEVMCALSCANFPALAPLTRNVRRGLKKRFSSFSTSFSSSRGRNGHLNGHTGNGNDGEKKKYASVDSRPDGHIRVPISGAKDFVEDRKPRIVQSNEELNSSASSVTADDFADTASSTEKTRDLEAC